MKKDKDVLVSGPTTCIRLENKNLNKRLYIFIDAFFPLIFECKDPHSKTITQYLSKNFQNVDDRIDFFLPISPQVKNKDYISHYEMEYHRKVEDLFMKIFTSKDTNIRTHYYGITSYVDYLLNNSYSISDEIKKLGNNHSITNYNKIMIFLDELLNDINYFRLTIFGDNKTKFSEAELKIIKYIKKIKKFTKNNFDDVYDSINNFFETIINIIKKIKSNLTDLSKRYNETSPMILVKNGYTDITEIDKELYNDTISLSNILYSKTKDLINTIDNLYFIRRFIEKSYINNAVVYAFERSSIYILFLLIKKFDFIITNITENTENIKKIQNTFKKTSYNNYKYENLSKLILPNEYTQCINMKDFPKYFK